MTVVVTAVVVPLGKDSDGKSLLKAEDLIKISYISDKNADEVLD